MPLDNSLPSFPRPTKARDNDAKVATARSEALFEELCELLADAHPEPEWWEENTVKALEAGELLRGAGYGDDDAAAEALNGAITFMTNRMRLLHDSRRAVELRIFFRSGSAPIQCEIYKDEMVNIDRQIKDGSMGLAFTTMRNDEFRVPLGAIECVSFRIKQPG